MFLLVWKMRQSIEFQKSRAIIQALMSQQGAQDEAIKSAFTDLKDAFFPFDKNQKSAENKQFREILERNIKQGPLAVIPSEDQKQKRRSLSQIMRAEDALISRNKMKEQGKIQNMDPFTKAKRRPR